MQLSYNTLKFYMEKFSRIHTFVHIEIQVLEKIECRGSCSSWPIGEADFAPMQVRSSKKLSKECSSFQALIGILKKKQLSERSRLRLGKKT